MIALVLFQHLRKTKTMGQTKQTNWITKRIADTAEKACTKSVSLLKAKNAAGFEDAVPKIRENFKSIRAALRLVRDDHKSYKKENEFYRDEAKKILVVQQAIAMVKAVDLINEQYSERLYKNAFTDLREKLETHKKKEIESALNEEHIFQEMRQNLDGKCGNFKDTLSKPLARETIVSGLKKVYERGRKAQKKLSDTSTNETIHELQKRTNYLEIQLALLSPIWSEMIDVWQAELQKLSHLLLTSEALNQLSGFLRDNSDTKAKEEGVYLMNTLIEGHKEQVQQHAVLSAQKIFSLKPKHFIKIFTTAWDAYNSESAQKILP